MTGRILHDLGKVYELSFKKLLIILMKGLIAHHYRVEMIEKKDQCYFSAFL